MASETWALEDLHILVVEDDENARTVLRDLFAFFGAYVTVAESARSALLRLRDVDADVVVADMRLGGHNGSWLLREARKSGSRAAFVAVTAYEYDENALRAEGFTIALPKPLHRESLLQAVLSAAKRR
jgi:CheY-like chemotaxis protein